MHNLRHRIVCLAMTGTLAMAGLAGCGGQAGQVTQTNEPTSAAELAEMNEKTTGAKNHHFEGEFEVSLDIVGQALPVKTLVAGDTVDGGGIRLEDERRSAAMDQDDGRLQPHRRPLQQEPPV